MKRFTPKLVDIAALLAALTLPFAPMLASADPAPANCNQPPTQCWADSACSIAGSPSCSCTWYWSSPNQCIPE